MRSKTTVVLKNPVKLELKIKGIRDLGSNFAWFYSSVRMFLFSRLLWAAPFQTRRRLRTKDEVARPLTFNMAVIFVVFLLNLFLCLTLAKKDVFHEELLLKPLPTGHVYAHFQFTTVWNVDIRDSKACE